MKSEKEMLVEFYELNVKLSKLPWEELRFVHIVDTLKKLALEDNIEEMDNIMKTHDEIHETIAKIGELSWVLEAMYPCKKCGSKKWHTHLVEGCNLCVDTDAIIEENFKNYDAP